MVNKKEWNTDMYYNMDEPWGGEQISHKSLYTILFSFL